MVHRTSDLTVLTDYAVVVAHVPPRSPDTNFQRWAQDAKDLFLRLITKPFERTRKEVVSESPSLCNEDKWNEVLIRVVILGVCGTFLRAQCAVGVC